MIGIRESLKTTSLPPEAAISLLGAAQLYRCGGQRRNIAFAAGKYIAVCSLSDICAGAHAIYAQGAYDIRLTASDICADAQENDYGKYLCFS